MTLLDLAGCRILWFGLGMVLAGTPGHADAPAELKATLERLNGREPLAARVELDAVTNAGEAKTPGAAPVHVIARVAETDRGLEIRWAPDQLRAADEEAKGPDPEHRREIRQAMDSLSPTALDGYLNGARDLRRELEHAEFTGIANETLDGRATRVLRFKLNPPLDEKDRKYIKELDATARVWIDADGTPLAAESRIRIKGRALLVIGFESTQFEQYRFARVGRRLVVTRHVQEQSGSGGGEHNQQKRTVALTVDSAG